MNLEIEATYENGALKLDHTRPLNDGQRVKVTVHQRSGRARASAGIFAWKGSRKDFECLTGPDNYPWNCSE
jgi:predicted DNA-binding antitoxin AbrB/MazE fold protein